MSLSAEKMVMMTEKLFVLLMEKSWDCSLAHLKERQMVALSVMLKVKHSDCLSVGMMASTKE